MLGATVANLSVSEGRSRTLRQLDVPSLPITFRPQTARRDLALCFGQLGLVLGGQGDGLLFCLEDRRPVGTPSTPRARPRFPATPPAHRFPERDRAAPDRRIGPSRPPPSSPAHLP